MKTFEKIKDLYLSKTDVPKENNWQSLFNNDIWLNVVAQVMVVGGSKPFEKFNKDENLKEQIQKTSLEILTKKTLL